MESVRPKKRLPGEVLKMTREHAEGFHVYGKEGHLESCVGMEVTSARTCGTARKTASRQEFERVLK